MMVWMMKRGEVYWVDLNPTKGSEINKLRPCVVISATPINLARRTVVVVPLSTQAKLVPPITVAVNCLGRQVAAVCDQVRTVDKSRLVKRADSLSFNDLSSLNEAMRQVLCIN